ncbi:MAG: cytochrome c3 family protein [Anaerolineae bacterium]
MNKRPGCFAWSGLLAALATILIVIGVVFFTGGAIFSPGPLSTKAGPAPLGDVSSHADLADQCAACHAAPWSSRPMANRCLVCHTDVAGQLRMDQSLHGQLLPPTEPLTCRGCHTEHGGTEAALTVVDPGRFPHGMVGFVLEGHQSLADGQPFTCDSCHRQDLTRFEVGTCADCHRDLDTAFMQAHLETFGQACLACHDGLDTYGPAFDHNLVAFPLQSSHAPLACIDCHQGAQTITDLQATPQDCLACHGQDDPHQGRFGGDCAQCHTVDGWQDATFDHALTMFPLTGAHAGVECVACHIDNAFAGTPQDCLACHGQDDPHQGRFGGDCAQCHTVDGWQDATFDHALTMFPLTGAHAGVECVACHIDNAFAGTPQECAACHAEPEVHAGLFGPDCLSCHTVQAWTPAQFTGPHTFPMDHGEEGLIACQTCHPDSLQTYTCYNCHEHRPDKIEKKHRKEGISDFQNCVQCHPTGREEEGERREHDDDDDD